MINSVIDISHWQKIIDIDKIKASGIIGVIQKATQGTGMTDTKFAGRRIAFKEKGFLFGSYHFLSRNGRAEADHYLDVIGDVPADEMIMLDTESQALSTRDNIIQSEKFVERIFEKKRRYPVWYIGNFLLNQYAQFASYEGSILLNCPLFIARYSKNQPTVPKFFNTWSLWQYTQDGIVDGITTVDRDIFNGDMEGLLKLWNAGSRAEAFQGVTIAVDDIPDNA